MTSERCWCGDPECSQCGDPDALDQAVQLTTMLDLLKAAAERAGWLVDALNDVNDAADPIEELFLADLCERAYRLRYKVEQMLDAHITQEKGKSK